MAKTQWSSEVRLTTDVNADDDRRDEERDPDRPFVILIVGNLTGIVDDAQAPAPGPLASRRVLSIDRDNFDAVLASVRPTWAGELEGLPDRSASRLPVHLTFREIDDFHPDRIVERLAPLRLLLETRRALGDPARFERIAAEVMQWGTVKPSPAPTGRASTPPAFDENPAELLDRILDQSGGAPATAPAGELQRFVEAVVGPYVVQVDRGRQSALVDAVDAALSQQLRSILHDQGFQRLEALWRNLHWLVRDGEADAPVKLRVLQLNRRELQDDAIGGEDPADSALGRLLLVQQAASPALLVADYEFTHGREDVLMLRHLGAIARRLRAPLVAAASPALLGCHTFTEIPSGHELLERFQDSVYDEWRALRRTPEAQWLALVLPKLLRRLPYGERTEPLQSFSFEEVGEAHGHEELLWGNAAFGVAVLAARAFVTEGWMLDLSRTVQTLDGLPLYVFDDAGSAVTQPCAETLLSDSVIQALAKWGLLPVASYRDADSVALPCVQSLSDPPTPLSWSFRGTMPAPALV